METVVEENPLSLATSRMVTIEALSPVLTRAARWRQKPRQQKPKRESPIPPRIPALEFEEMLADTTAETTSSVKRWNQAVAVGNFVEYVAEPAFSSSRNGARSCAERRFNIGGKAPKRR